MARYTSCACCGRTTPRPHYKLVAQADEWAPFRNVALCVACHHAGCDSEHECLAYPAADGRPLTSTANDQSDADYRSYPEPLEQE